MCLSVGERGAGTALFRGASSKNNDKEAGPEETHKEGKKNLIKIHTPRERKNGAELRTRKSWKIPKATHKRVKTQKKASPVLCGPVH